MFVKQRETNRVTSRHTTLKYKTISKSVVGGYHPGAVQDTPPSSAALSCTTESRVKFLYCLKYNQQSLMKWR